MQKRRVISIGLVLVMLLSLLPMQFSALATGSPYTGTGFEIQYKVTSKWSGAQNIQMTLKNTGSTVLDNWAVGFTASGSADSPWSCAIGTGSEGYCVIENAGWNAKIAVNGSVTFGFTLRTDETFSPDVFHIGDEARNPPVTPDIELSTGPLDLGDIENLIAAGAIEIIQNDDITIRTIIGAFSGILVYNEEDAARVFNQAAGLLGSSSPIAEAAEITKQTVEAVDEDDITEHFYRLNKVVNGIPVLGSGIVLSTDADGVPTGLFSTYDNRIRSVNTTPTVTEAAAKATAVTAIQNSLQTDYGSLPDGFMEALACESELLIYAMDEEKQPALVWKVVVYSPSEEIDEDEIDEDFEDEFIEVEDEPDSILPDISMTYYVYANGASAGDVLLAASNLVGAWPWEWQSTTDTVKDLLEQDREINIEQRGDKQRLRDDERNITTRGNSIFGSIIQRITTDAWDKSTISAHANVADAYNFYKDLGHISYDNDESEVKVYTGERSSTNLLGSHCKEEKGEIYLKPGDESALDIVGHEYTHAVIYNISQLGSMAYEYGALNEAYGDIMGSLIEGKPRNDEARWTFGESSTNKNEDEGKLRRMDTEAHYKDFDINGNLYVNSTIFSHAIYKMMIDTRTDDRVSDKKWANVFYRSLYRLNKNSSFLDGRTAIYSAAEQLGFISGWLDSIKDAFDAVGIYEPATIRIVLRWGATPYVLDSHLTGPSAVGDGNRFHILWNQLEYHVDGTHSYNPGGSGYSTSSADKLAANIDHDVMVGYGPEVVRIRLLTPGEYYYYVFDWDNREMGYSNALANSGANVSVYWGSSNTVMPRDPLQPNGAKAVFNVDGSSPGLCWSVFKITIAPPQAMPNAPARERVTITPINTYSYSVPGVPFS